MSSALQFSVVPPVQAPPVEHVVLYVHRFESSHEPPTLIGVDPQVESPSHV